MKDVKERLINLGDEVIIRGVVSSIREEFSLITVSVTVGGKRTGCCVAITPREVEVAIKDEASK